MRILTGEEDLRELSRDAGVLEVKPAMAYVASDESEVADALSGARAKGLGVTPRGSGTSIPTQSVGRGAILLQDRKRAVLVESGRVSCEPALVKSELNVLLGASGRWMPVDPSSYESCSVGGMVANNASGSRTFKYGSTIDYVEQLRVVLPEEGPVEVRPLEMEDALRAGGTTGRLARILLDNQRTITDEKPKVSKNSSGYRLERLVHDDILDLPRLFVGSEGTLGVITGVTFSTLPKPGSRSLLVFETDLRELEGLTARLRSKSPSALELLDKAIFRQTGRQEMIKSISRTERNYLVFAEFEEQGSDEEVKTLEAVAEDHGIAALEPIAITDPGEVASAWAVRNGTLKVAAEIRRGGKSPVPGVEDLVVPPDRLGDLIAFVVGEFDRRGLQYISYGHAGDANLHMRPLLDTGSRSDMKLLRDLMDDCFEEVWRMGGSISGEHGDGMLRGPYVRRQYPRTYDVMRQVKSLYDPKGIMNPGVKIF